MSCTAYKNIILIITATAIVSCSGENRHKDSHINPVPVRVDTVQISTAISDRSFVGTVSPSKSVMIINKYPGKLISVHVRQGDEVSKGDILAEVESQNIISTYDMTQATLRQAEDGYSRLMQVKATNSVPEVKAVEVETQLKQARASAKASAKALEECKIKAPFSGVVGGVMVDTGVDIAPAEIIMSLFDINSLEVKISVPENEVWSISKGDCATLIIPALNNKRIKAHVTSKGVVASPLSHTYDCTLDITSDATGLMPGMVCKVYMANQTENSIIIPANIIKMDNIGKYVWIVTDNIVSKRYITISDFSGHGIIVTSGLSVGDAIITDGSQKVSTGMTVTVIK